MTDTNRNESIVQNTVGRGPIEHGQLSNEQGYLIDENGTKFQLRGISTHGIGWYPEYINAGAMKTVRETGGNVIHIAMYTDA